MGFELHITCSKDIDELYINFSDGTSTIVENKRKENKNDIKNKVTSKNVADRNVFLDTDIENENINHEIVKPPEISLEERPVKIANELQNLDI